MRIYLIRHGRTEWNDTGKYQGQADIPLSAEGREELRPSELSPKMVYRSSLHRAAETASLIFPHAEQVVVPGLEEMDFGVFEGRSYREMADDAAYRTWVDGGCLGRCPGGEDLASFSHRVCAAFGDLLDSADGDVYIVAHGGTQMAVAAAFFEPKQDYFSAMTPCGAGYVLDGSDWRQNRTLTVLETVSFTQKGDL